MSEKVDLFIPMRSHSLDSSYERENNYNNVDNKNLSVLRYLFNRKIARSYFHERQCLLKRCEI